MSFRRSRREGARDRIGRRDRSLGPPAGRRRLTGDACRPALHAAKTATSSREPVAAGLMSRIRSRVLRGRRAPSRRSKTDSRRSSKTSPRSKNRPRRSKAESRRSKHEPRRWKNESRRPQSDFGRPQSVSRRRHFFRHSAGPPRRGAAVSRSRWIPSPDPPRFSRASRFLDHARRSAPEDLDFLVKHGRTNRAGTAGLLTTSIDRSPAPSTRAMTPFVSAGVTRSLRETPITIWPTPRNRPGQLDQRRGSRTNPSASPRRRKPARRGAPRPRSHSR